MNCKDISTIFNSLTSEERDVLGLLLKLSKSKLLLKFNEYISTGGEIDIEACEVVYGNLPDSKYSHLKNRYVDLVLTALRAMSINSYTDYHPNKIALNRLNRLVSSLTLISKDLYGIALNLYKNDDLYSNDIDFVEIQILEQSFVNRSFSISSLSDDDVLRLSKSITENIEILKVLGSSETMYKYLAKKMSSALYLCREDKLKIISEIENQVNIAQSFCLKDQVNASRWVRLLYKYKILYYGINTNLDGLDELISDFRKYIVSLKVKYDFEVGGLYYVSALYKIRHEYYEEAILDLDLAKECFGVAHKKYVESLYLIWLCKFYLKDWSSINEYRADCYLKSSSFLRSGVIEKFEYILINMYLSIGDFQEGYDLLNRYNSLFLDRSGWRVGYKYIEILYLFHLRDFAQVALRIDSFRKLIASLQGFEVSRARVMVTLMRSLLRHGLDFKRTLRIKVRLIKILEEASTIYSWDNTGYELIRFESWFLKNISKEDLQLYYSSDNTEQSADKD